MQAFRRQAIFHQIGSHPRLRLAHERPFIFLVPDFFSEQECSALQAKAAAHLSGQSYDNPAGGERTSFGCTMRNDEIPSLRRRIASLAAVSESQLQPLKVSRYERGQRFAVHTDAVRGDLRGASPEPDDWWGDRARGEYGVEGAPIAGVNRIATIFVYLNDVARGGRTRWRWTNHDAAVGGTRGATFYDAPGPSAGVTDLELGSGDEFSVAPQTGLAVLHFPAATAAAGGWTDYNAFHEAEPPEDVDKWVAQQFIWSHPRLDWRRVLDVENHEPARRRSELLL